MMDFSASGVERQHYLGSLRGVKEPSTIQITVSGGNLNLTTSLPYVEVVSERVYKYKDGVLIWMWVEKDRIIMLTIHDTGVCLLCPSHLSRNSDKLTLSRNSDFRSPRFRRG
jgi:hypothetical protein